MERTGLFKRCVAEGIGTALLVLIGPGTAAFNGLITANNNESTTLADIGVISFAFAIVVMAMIYSIGKFSGCHINPAVTMALASTGHFPWKEVFPYLIAQCVGGVIGAFGIVMVLGIDGVLLGNLGATVLAPSTGYFQAIAIEAIAAFILMFVIMGIAVDSRAPKEWGGLVIGLTVGGIIMMFAGPTGASFNPARTFGPYVVDSLLGGNIDWIQFPIYVIGPLIGAIAAAVTYNFIASSRQLQLSSKSSHNEVVK
ncbi:MIP/aquaporin family protein [Cytobacillus dafuensis]|uniref:Aquaporin family protein n=1 Tax=Cytobacillus dafuensis TaxID=1742359 RepID=A0A5B8Z073_CYTDA|nr:MIP/aquaporin family protein [Cytobacillus dafuensis]QED46117.1 aquaporin family protein [Cytobacillus dafuensis]